MARELTEAELALVAKHGQGQFERALATVQLAERRGRADDLRELVTEILDSQTDEPSA